MFTGSSFSMSDYFIRKNIVQQIAGLSAKNLLIDTIREIFRGDSFYPYRSDVYGYPKVIDHTGIDEDSDDSTKINISDTFNYEAIHIPTITVRQSGGSYFPISFNQEGIPGLASSIVYREEVVLDGYGNTFTTKIPDKHLFAGAWNLNYDIKISAESTGDREEIAGITSIGLMHIHRYDLQQAGLFIKNMSFGSESEEEYNNDKFYTQSLSLECFGEWRREVPVGDLIDRIVFFFDIGRIVDGVVTPSNNLSVQNMVVDLS